MKYALLRCCATTTMLKQNELTTNAVLRSLGVEFFDVKEFNCCGYPLKNSNHNAFVLASTRNLALAEKRDMNILTLCNCCFGSMKHAEHMMKTDESLQEAINASLGKESLHYSGKTEAKHFLQMLYEDIGIETVRARIKKTFKGLKLAVHYGCHLLRPRKIVHFDNPFAPTKLDQLVELTGATSIPWSDKLECCGAPILGVNHDLSLDLTVKKLSSAKEAGADYLCTSCPYCQLQFDRVQKMVLAERDPDLKVPAILFSQLLGLSLGLDPDSLGLNENQVAITDIQRFLSPS